MSSLIQIDMWPSTRALTQFGTLASMAFLLLGYVVHSESWVYTVHVDATRAMSSYALWVMSAFAGGCALLFPRANLPLYWGLSLVTYPVGILVSYVALGLLFFFLITPVAIALRLLKRVDLQQHSDPAATTYWREARPPRTKASYFKQY